MNSPDMPSNETAPRREIGSEGEDSADALLRAAGYDPETMRRRAGRSPMKYLDQGFFKTIVTLAIVLVVTVAGMVALMGVMRGIVWLASL